MREIAPIFDDLRRQLLSLDPVAAGIEPVGPSGVWGALMEIGYENGVASFAMLADGTTSMYTSTGGGIIGGGGHESVVRATRAYLAELERHLAQFRLEDGPAELPAAGEVHFRALTTNGRLLATGPERDLGERRHDLSPLFYAGQDVITELRTIDEARR